MLPLGLSIIPSETLASNIVLSISYFLKWPPDSKVSCPEELSGCLHCSRLSPELQHRMRHLLRDLYFCSVGFCRRIFGVFPTTLECGWRLLPIQFRQFSLFSSWYLPHITSWFACTFQTNQHWAPQLWLY
jgi:hypothetical protein